VVVVSPVRPLFWTKGLCAVSITTKSILPFVVNNTNSSSDTCRGLDAFLRFCYFFCKNFTDLLIIIDSSINSSKSNKNYKLVFGPPSNDYKN
jgi:hypothetical protein